MLKVFLGFLIVGLVNDAQAQTVSMNFPKFNSQEAVVMQNGELIPNTGIHAIIQNGESGSYSLRIGHRNGWGWVSDSILGIEQARLEVVSWRPNSEGVFAELKFVDKQNPEKFVMLQYGRMAVDPAEYKLKLQKNGADIEIKLIPDIQLQLVEE